MVQTPLLVEVLAPSSSSLVDTFPGISEDVGTPPSSASTRAEAISARYLYAFALSSFLGSVLLASLLFVFLVVVISVVVVVVNVLLLLSTYVLVL